MKFISTREHLKDHAKIKAEEVGFFSIDNPCHLNQVVFKTEDGIYFTAYGQILQVVE